MSISKKERTLSIWIGLTIGITVSSLLFRYALDEKEKKALERPGNYDSLESASGQPFDPLPESVSKSIPSGIVVYFDRNESVSGKLHNVPQWVIETTGAFRSERLFILVEENSEMPGEYQFYRASELYLKARENSREEELEEHLDPERYKLIGRNEKTGEWILQIKYFSPSDIRSTMKELVSHSNLNESLRLSSWEPKR